jgi:hypothetical protein
LDRRDQQLAANEALFRDVNETVAEVATKIADQILFLCECADEFCAESISLTREEYERVRAVSEHFIVKPGHFRPDVERIIEQQRDHWLVEKLGEAAEIAERTDPRS